MDNDLADALDDMICAADKVVADPSTDVLIAIVGWIVLAGGVFAATKYIVKNITLTPAATAPAPPATNGVAAHRQPGFLTELVKDQTLTSRVVGSAPPPSSPEKTRIDPEPEEVKETRPPPPTAVGSNPEAVEWVNNAFQAAYAHPAVYDACIKLWLDSLTEHTKSSGIEVCQFFFSTKSSTYISTREF